MRGINHAADFGWSNAPRFGGGGGGTTSTNTIQNSDPWVGQQGPLNRVYNTAETLQDQNNFPQYFPGNTYAPLTQQQQGLQNTLIGYTANGGTANDAALDSLKNGALGSNYTAASQPSYDASQGYLSNMIGGATLDPFKAPGFQNVVAGTLANVLPAVNSSFVGGNRNGGLNTAAATSAATNAIGSLANQNYLQEQNLQAGAAQQAGTNFLTQQGNQLKGAALAPMVDQGITGNLGTSLSTAGMSQQDIQNQLNANVAAYNYGQMAPWNNLGLFENAIVGTGSPGSSSNTTGTQPYFTNPTANAASAASAAAALGMLAFTAFSDRNLKTDIDEIGETHSGFPLYTFRYKWEGPMARHIGVMAQDVEKTRPHAVIHTPVGRMVNYMEALAA